MFDKHYFTSVLFNHGCNTTHYWKLWERSLLAAIFIYSFSQLADTFIQSELTNKKKVTKTIN